jgi:hypothetical protein
MSLSIITMLTFKKFFLEVGLFNESLKSGEFLEWYARANKLGFNSVTLSEIAALRRLHPGNSLSKGMLWTTLRHVGLQLPEKNHHKDNLEYMALYRAIYLDEIF